MSDQEIGANPNIVEPDVHDALFDEFYERLNYLKVEAGDVKPDDIHRCQEIQDKLQTMRVSLGKDFTAEELTDKTYRQLQTYAKTFGIPANQGAKELIEQLTGKPKSLAVRRMKITKATKRLKLARDKLGIPYKQDE